MKLSLLQENLNTALNNVSRFVSSKNQLPVLGNILFTTDNGRFKLSATNLELSINYWIGAKIEKEGSVTLPAKEITEFISYLPVGKIDLDLNDKQVLNVNSVKSESSFATTPTADFPEFPTINPDTIFELDMSVLSQAVSQIAFSAATDDSRPVLTAILCIFTSNTLTLVATDGFRLSFKNIKLVNPINLKSDEDNITFLIPARSLIEVNKLAKSASMVKIGLTNDGHQVVFVFDDVELISRLIEGNFPEYQRIVPESYTTKIYLNREEFAQAIKIASVFARESANVVKFNIKNNTIDLTANAPQIGHNKATVEARIEGEPLDIAFNYKFISDFLSVCKSEEIIIELNESLTPGFFHDQSHPDFTHIIMPVRLQD